MKVLVVEDEYGVARYLCDLLQELEPGIEILSILESIEDSVKWLSDNPTPDLGFFDIRLADGNSFEIFRQVEVDFPVVFTTAYDEFALNAFRLNSIDYLLKPIAKEDLQRSLDKYRTLHRQFSGFDKGQLLKAIEEMKAKPQGNYKKNFLVHFKNKIIPLSTESIAYFMLRDELIFCITRDNKRYLMDQSLEKIMTQLNPLDFFRANRQFILSKKAITEVSRTFNRKLLVNILPPTNIDVVVSKSSMKAFKNWLDS